MKKTSEIEIPNGYILILDNYLKLIKLASGLSQNNIFSKQDLRNDFFLVMDNIIFNYYLEFQLPYFLQKLIIPFNDGILTKYFSSDPEKGPHFDNISHLLSKSNIKPWHDSRKMILIISIWIVFEDCIDVIYHNIVTQDELELQKNNAYLSISKFIQDLPTEKQEKIKKKLRSEFIGLGNKYNYIFKKINKKVSDKIKINEYRMTLEFLNAIRNTMHSNSRPLKDAEYNLPYGKFNLRKGEFIDFLSDDVVINAIRHLLECFDFIRINLAYDGLIIHSATNSHIFNQE